MNNYIKEYCVLPPLEKPLYDKDSDTWDVWFELRKNSKQPGRLENLENPGKSSKFQIDLAN